MMSKIFLAGIGIFMLLVLIGGANAIAVENIRKLEIPETDLWDVVISPDGTQLAYVTYDENHQQQVYIINSDGTGKKRLTDDANKKWGLAWGKDKIAYVSFGKDGLEKIFVMNPDGTGNAQLIPDNTRQGNAASDKPPVWAAPSWSPDGTSLLYTSLDEKANQKMYIVNADGTGKRMVFDGNLRQWSPAFSPDGKNIVYVSYSPEKNKEELFIVDAGGLSGRQITFDEIKKNYPVWGPEGMIIFVSYETLMSPGEKLFSINQDGTGKRLFIDGSGDNKQRFPSFSRDGSRFAYAAVDVSGDVKIAVGDITGITVTMGTAKATAAPSTPVQTGGTTSGRTPLPDKNKATGLFESPLWSAFLALSVAVILLLIWLFSKNFFRK